MKSRAHNHYFLAGFLCLLGFALHILLSDPLLDALGFTYSGDEGKFYEKIHPGTLFMFLSLFILLWQKEGFLKQAIHVFKEQKAYSILLLIYVLALIYMTLKSGPRGMAFIIDAHISAVICAIVLSYAPVSLCRPALHFFIVAAVINSLIGIAEAHWQLRIFTFDDDWVVLHEDYFRASAFLGHPLTNAIFTSLALFVSLAMGYPKIIKAILIVVFLVALVAFGGRVALAFSVVGLIILGIHTVIIFLSRKNLKLREIFLLGATLLTLPLMLGGILFIAINSHMGERIATHLEWERSADTRLSAFKVFDYMTDEEIMFGARPERIMDIAYRVNPDVKNADIENPWLVMFMYMGALVFPFWLAGISAFIYTLMKGQTLPLQFAVLAYFMIASTSNSFGHKDANFAIMVCVITCAAQMAKHKIQGADEYRTIK